LSNENYEQALRDFEIVASFDENYADIYYYKGKAKTNLGDIQSAIKDFFRAIELGSRKNGVFNGISEAYLKGGKFEKALIYSNISLEK
jgi:tetratricopeptide (TPR) repeat protein